MRTYTIKEISTYFNLPASTLRYYEEIGLLNDVKRTSNNQRIYTDEHIARLKGINCFKNTGLPIAKIQEFYKYENNIPEHIDEIVNLVTEHEENTKLQIQKMQNDLLHIQHKVRYYNGIKNALKNNEELPYWNDFKV